MVDTAGGAAFVAHNISNLGVKVVAQRAAADSVIAMGSTSSSSAAAAAAQSNTCGQQTQRECDVARVSSVDSPVDSATGDTGAVAVVSSTK